MPIVNIKGVGDAYFPGNMPIEDIRNFLRNKYSQRAIEGQSDLLAPQPATIEPYQPTLAQRLGGSVAEGLKGSGLISDNYGAQSIGRNVTALGEFLPGIGDATAGDEFGRALQGGDGFGMAMAGLGVIPVAGDLAKKGARKVFHGSDRRIDEYMRGVNTKGRLGAGIYFGDEKKANVFAKLAKIKKQPSFLNEAEIISDNPKIVTEDTLLQYPQGGFPAEAFEKQGYTGIQLIDENTGRIIEETVFDPKNIKSLNPKDSTTTQSLPMDEVKKVTSYNDMFDFTPEQMAQQLRSSKPENVIDGVYIEPTKFGEKRFNPDGSVEIVKGGEVLRRIEPQDADMAYKNKIMKNESEKPEVQAAQEKRRAEFDAERERQKAQEAESYKMQHTAPTREGNPSGDDLTDTFGSDIYTSNALQYFGTGSSYDNKAINIIQGMKGKPNKPVTIYRAVPKDVKEINASDWVTTTKEYAQDHMKGEKGWHILSKKVKAKDIATDGNSIHEFGYDPQ